jgi:hypothetical protein
MPWVQLDGTAPERGHQRAGRLDQQVARPHERGAERGVDDIGRGQPEVHPRGLVERYPLLDDVDERRHVVVGHALALSHGLDERPVHLGRAFAHGHGRGGWDDAGGRLPLHRQQLHLEPQREAGLVAPQCRHVGRRVARDHLRAAPSTASLAMSLR